MECGGCGGLAEDVAEDLWMALHGCAVGMLMTARAVGKVAGRQKAPRVARGIGGLEVTSSILFRENGIPGISFQACPYLPESTIICLT